MPPDAADLVQRLQLQPHPEGGWYRETWRAPGRDDSRGAGTAVIYLLEAGHRSRWNRDDASEVWLWHAGDPVILETASDNDSPIERRILGLDLTSGQSPQLVVEPGAWQAAEIAGGGSHGFALISCVVAPAFDFATYELAPPGWAPGSEAKKGD